MTIKDAIYLYFDSFLKKERIYSKTGVVSNVNSTTKLCDVLPNDGSPMVYNVRLQAIKDAGDNGILVLPKNGTECIITFINKNIAFLSQCKEVDKIIIAGNNESLKEVLNDLITSIKALTVTTPAGPSGTPINFASFDSINVKINNLFEN
jgi:hypothetical protein